MPIRPHNPRTRTLWGIGCAVLVPLLARSIDIEVFGHWEVRIDCGDLRRNGLVFASLPRRLRPEWRVHLIEASKKLGVPAEWCRVRYIAPSNGDIGGRAFLYSRTAFWLQEEPELGKAVLSQIADYFQYPPAESGYPASTSLLWCLQWDANANRYVIDEDRLLRNGNLATELEAFGHDPRAGGTLAKYLATGGYARFLIDSATSQGGSKYHWQRARVVRVISCYEKWTIGDTIEFAHIFTMDDVPEGQHVLHLEHMDGPPEWWRLAKCEPAK